MDIPGTVVMLDAKNIAELVELGLTLIMVIPVVGVSLYFLLKMLVAFYKN